MISPKGAPVYIIYSKKLDRFYVGSTILPVKERLEEHNNKRNKGSFTTKGIPWELAGTISCTRRIQAYRIERHIKKMKSRSYIENVLKYPEMRRKLLGRFS